MNKIYLTHEDTSRMITQLCAELLPFQNQFQWIVGIERGGIPISTWLAYVLNKQHKSILISRYGDGMTPDGLYICQVMDLPKTPFLLVDDIVDSGKTIQCFKELKYDFIPKFWIATLHWCEENSPDQRPDFFVEKKKKSDWIVYPWETEKRA